MLPFIYILGFFLCISTYPVNIANKFSKNSHLIYNHNHLFNFTLLLDGKQCLLSGSNFDKYIIEAKETMYVSGCILNKCKIECSKEVYLSACNLNKCVITAEATVHLSGCKLTNVTFDPNIKKVYLDGFQTNNLHIGPDTITVTNSTNYIKVSDSGSICIFDGAGNSIIMNNGITTSNKEKTLDIPNTIIINDKNSIITYSWLGGTFPSLKFFMLASAAAVLIHLINHKV